ncbi:hypothetical protein L596_029104 [Steinernema carpocapsae]|uniref:Uncharacterized protein n=1 Tax=Steinernema carpocapsae TaxID=34508 RepID=A0A4V5ZXL4_STECR|nr:hypothetical protein L596_029104 [Steinernema carpocapsae]
MLTNALLCNNCARGGAAVERTKRTERLISTDSGPVNRSAPRSDCLAHLNQRKQASSLQELPFTDSLPPELK